MHGIQRKNMLKAIFREFLQHTPQPSGMVHWKPCLTLTEYINVQFDHMSVVFTFQTSRTSINNDIKVLGIRAPFNLWDGIFPI